VFLFHLHGAIFGCYIACPDKVGLAMIGYTEKDRMNTELFKEYGPYAPLSRMWRLLSYVSVEAARKSFARGTFPVEGIQLPGRRGVYLRTADVADWVAKSAKNASISDTTEAH
jgi:hypothetical protein